MCAYVYAHATYATRATHVHVRKFRKHVSDVSDVSTPSNHVWGGVSSPGKTWRFKCRSYEVKQWRYILFQMRTSFPFLLSRICCQPMARSAEAIWRCRLASFQRSRSIFRNPSAISDQVISKRAGGGKFGISGIGG